MLYAMPDKSCSIIKAERSENRFYLYSERGMYRIEAKGAGIVRITYTEREKFSEREKPGVLQTAVSEQWEYSDDGEKIVYRAPELVIEIDKKSASFTYYDGSGGLLLRERERDSRELEEFQSYELSGEQEAVVEKIVTPDGTKEVIREAARVPGERFYHTRLHLQWQEGEALYGLGQHEEGFLNLRGQTVFVHQANRKIAIPMLLSNLGYGILMDTYSPMIFNDTVYGSYLYTEADDEQDFYFMNGGSMDGVIRQYRYLTGKAALLPKWAFGYLQSQERYETAEEILQVAEQYRERGIGIDGIVLDWLSWEDNLWGQKTFDKKRFPNPEEMINRLHAMQVHFMISIWPTMDEKCENYKEFKEKELLLPGSNVYNAFSEEGRRLYWNQVNEGLFCHGIDAWWCDSSEPYTPEWNHKDRPEPAKLYAEYIDTTKDHMPTWALNAFGLYHAKALYEGQRQAQAASGREKRVVNLTRSSYTGQQRYGTILWSGDTEARWSTFRKQIAAGLNFCAGGMPYWTTDIGAFFVKSGNQWFWQGDYAKGAEDLGYRELYVRWYQWSCFLPILRAHGTDCRRELWAFGEPGEPFYEALLAANRLRYRFLPYIYSLAGAVWLEDASMIKPLVFAFPKDAQVTDCKDQYLFGDRLMVCPVTEPMYYGVDSVALQDVPKCRKVYLPAGERWYDFWTEECYEGGQWLEAPALLDRIPLYVREGSILPLYKKDCCFVSEHETGEDAIEYRVYKGKDATFCLYEDAGDGYGYERGEYELTLLQWKDAEGELLKSCCNR
ncbi:MAG: glycoside hydrolase family 31 protein [Lachnospiraceae bacterium]|nr:glycoside hydrolase family 31 protein [Lachnospiraceae bacterium]